MKRSSFCGLAAVLLLSAGCAATETQVVLPGYNQPLDHRPVIAVLPLSADLVDPEQYALAGEEPATPYLNPRDRSLFYRYFGALMTDATTAEVIEPDPGLRPEGITYAYRTLPLQGDSVTVLVPQGGPATIDGRQPDFLLLVDDLFFDLGVQSMQRGAAPLSETRALLNGSFDYMLWDNAKQQPAAYGHIGKKTQVPEGLSREAYLRILEQLGQAVVRSGPLTYRIRKY